MCVLNFIRQIQVLLAMLVKNVLGEYDTYASVEVTKCLNRRNKLTLVAITEQWLFVLDQDSRFGQG